MRELTRYGNWLVTKSYGENIVEFRLLIYIYKRGEAPGFATTYIGI